MDKKLLKRKQALLERTCEILDINENDALEVFKSRKSSLRINKLKPTNFSTDTEGLKKVEWHDEIFKITSEKEKFTNSEHFRNGEYYIQNLSSILPVIALDPKENSVILDICSAPGGKAFSIANETNNKAKLYLNDSSFGRFKRLERITKNYNVATEEIFNIPGQFLLKNEKEIFDKIIVDAPCSGEGLIDMQNINDLAFWSTKKIKRLSKLQKMILLNAVNLLKKGGEIIYTTCTYSPEENEAVIDYVLKKSQNIHTKEIQLPINNVKKTLSSWKNKNFENGINKGARIIGNDYFEPFTIFKLEKDFS